MSGRGECVCVVIGASLMLRLLRRAVALARMLPTLNLSLESSYVQQFVFICNWIKKRREPRANNVTLKLGRVREAGSANSNFFILFSFLFFMDSWSLNLLDIVTTY